MIKITHIIFGNFINFLRNTREEVKLKTKPNHELNYKRKTEGDDYIVLKKDKNI